MDYFAKNIFLYVAYAGLAFLLIRSGFVLLYINWNVYLQDMKFGGTPLHWASSREVIETLADMGCDVDSTNFSQRTPLHVMVR